MTKNLHRFIRALLLTLASCWGSVLHAQGYATWQTCPMLPTSNTFTQFINVGIHAEVGDVIGPWMYLPTTTWNCNYWHTGNSTLSYFTDARVTVKVVAGNNVAGNSWGTIAHEGQSYRVYRANAGGQSVGYIVRYGATSLPNTPSLQAATAEVGQQSTMYAVSYPYGSLPSGAQISRYTHVQVRMVKIDNNFPSANSTFAFSPVRVVLETPRATGINIGDFGIPVDYQLTWDYQGEYPTNVIAQFFSVTAACTTPPITVDLGEQQTIAIPPANSPLMGTQIPFAFKNCPVYMGAVRYRFDPVPAGAPITNGVLPLIAPSTASGVGVQVFQQGDFFNQHPNLPPGPLAFGVTRELNLIDTYGYPGNWAIDYTLPLGARMVRLNSSVTPTPGTVFAQMKVVATYK